MDVFDDIAELFRKTGTGNGAGVAEILRYRPELSRCHDRNGLSILRFARYMRQAEVLAVLVEAGPPLDVFEAAALDDATAVSGLLSRDPALAASYDVSGQTALHIAASHGSAGAIDVLVAAGASLEARSRDERAETPLHVAVERVAVEVVRALLRHGSDPNARRNGTTVLMIAAGRNSRDIVEMLVARNVDVDLRDDGGRTASDIGAACGHVELAARIRLGERHIDRGLA